METPATVEEGATDSSMAIDLETYFLSASLSGRMFCSFEECGRMIDGLMSYLRKRDLRSVVRTSKLLDTISVYRTVMWDPRIEREAKKREFLRILSVVDLKRLRLQDYTDSPTLDAIYFNDAVHYGDVKLTRILLKYGVRSESTPMLMRRDEYCSNSMIKRFLLHAAEIQAALGLQDSPNANVIVSSFIAKGILLYRLYQQKGVEAFKKFQRILRYLEAVTRRTDGQNWYTGYVECLELQSRATTQPDITRQDVHQILGLIFGEGAPITKIICDAFDEIFPGRDTERKPRSLKHLCRCQVRENLRQERGVTLPAAVSVLLIPHTLKPYLLGKE